MNLSENMRLGLKDGDPQIQHIQEMKISPLFFEIGMHTYLSN